MMIGGTCLLLFLPKQILFLFAASESMIKIGVPAMRILSIGLVFCGFSIMIATYQQAIEKIRSSMLIHILRQGILLVPLMWLFNRYVWDKWDLDLISSNRNFSVYCGCFITNCYFKTTIKIIISCIEKTHSCENKKGSRFLFRRNWNLLRHFILYHIFKYYSKLYNPIISSTLASLGFPGAHASA